MIRNHEECQLILTSAAKHCAVNYNLMMQRLISKDDIDDIKHYRLDKKILIQFIILWRDENYPNYNKAI